MARPNKRDQPGDVLKADSISDRKPCLKKESLIVPPSSQDSGSRYQFLPLKEDEIRLIVLEEALGLSGAPGTFRWRGRLLHRSIKDFPVYIAASYAWGDPHVTFPLPMDDGTATIPVTENLWHFLEQHAENLVGQMLWIDQISINQNDLCEKSHQVQLMARIYESAQQTLIWLGREDDASNCVIDVIKKLDVSWPLWKAVLNVPFEAPRSAIVACLLKHEATLSLPPFDDRLKTLLGMFLKRVWFTRLWVLQEAVLSTVSAFLCGTLRCASTPLLCGLWVLTRVFHSDASYFMNTISCVSLLKLARETNRAANLFDLLELTRTGLKCTDARDKVYALISLQSAVPTSIVDYTISAQEVYTSMARHHISTSRSLSIFGEIYQSDDDSEYLHDLPSWVPNWTSKNEAGVIDKQNRFQASKERLWQPCPTENSTGLIVRGNIVDVVGIVESPCKMTTLAADCNMRPAAQAYLSVLAQKISHQQLHVVNPSSRASVVLTRTVTLGGTSGLPEMVADEKVELIWAALNSREDATAGISREAGVEAEGYWYKVGCVCLKRAIFWPSKHTIAVGPSTTEPGDAVCVLHGSTVPVILRRSSNDWKVVGQCYVDEIMLGEACTWSEDEARAFNLV